MAVVWFEISPGIIDVTPSGTSGWQEVDDSNVPDGAEAVTVQVQNTNTANTDHDFGIRNADSTDDRHSAIHEEGHLYIKAGVNATGKFDLYRDSTDIKYFLINYIPGADATFTTNGVDKTPGTAGSFQTITGTANSVQVWEWQGGSNDQVGSQSTTSTDDRINTNRRHNWHMALVDGSGNVEVYVHDLADNLMFQLGEITADISMLTNAVDRIGDLTDGLFTNITNLPTGAGGGIYRCVKFNDDAADEYCGVRADGSSRSVIGCTNLDDGLYVSEAVSLVVEGFADKTTPTGLSFFEYGSYDAAAVDELLSYRVEVGVP